MRMYYYIFYIFLFISGVTMIHSGKSSKKNIDSNSDKTKNLNTNKKQTSGKKNKENIKEDGSAIIKKLLSIDKKDNNNRNREENKKMNNFNRNATRVYDINTLIDNDTSYVNTQDKYDSRSSLNIRKCDIIDGYILELTKHISLNNNYIFDNDDEYLINMIFKGISNNKLKAYSDLSLEKEIDMNEIRDRMKKPVIFDGRRRKRNINNGNFKNSDINNIEIIGNVFWSNLSSDMIIDYLVVRLYIPTSRSKLDNDIVVCYLNYNDLVNYFNNISTKYKFRDGMYKIGDAILNDKFNVIYDKIEYNDYKKVFNKNNSDENKMSVKKILTEIKCNFFSR